MRKRTLFCRKRQYRRIFFRTLVALIALNIFACALLFHILHGVMSRNQVRETYQTNLSLLEQADYSVVQVIALLKQNMAQIIWNENVIQYLMDPYQFDADTGNGVFHILRDVVDSLYFVKEAYLYSSFSMEMYCDTGKIVAREEVDFRELLDWHERNLKKDGINEKRIVASLYADRDNIYLIADFYPGDRIGSLIYRLGNEEIYSLIQDKRWGSMKTSVFDRQGGQILEKGGGVDYQTLVDNGELLFGDPENACILEAEGEHYCLVHSQETGWKYVRQINQASLQLGWGGVFSYVLPVLASFLLISAILSFWIASRIYQPINRLMRLTASGVSRENIDSIQNETDYLELAYSDAIAKMEKMGNVIDLVRQEVIEQLFHGLLIGKSMEEDYILETLTSVDAPFSISGRFVVMTCVVLDEKKMENDGLKLGLYRAGITGIFQQLKPSAGRLYSLSMDTNRVAVVLVAPEEVSVLRIKQIISQLKLSFDQKVCTLPFECILSHGDICSSLLDLHSSYRESIQKIHMRTYGSGVEADSQPENGSQCVYQQVVSQIMQNMLDGGKDVAARRLDLVVSDIMASRSSLDVKKKNCEYLLEVLLGKVMEIQVDSEADICWDNGWSFSKTEIEGFDTEQEIELYTREACRQIGGILHVYSRKKVYRYISMAKDYIRMNYADVELSRDTIGEYIGISGAYLGHLFREATGDQLLDYLNAFRIEKAKQLLRGTRLSVKDIGFRCGFASAQSFIRVFKKYTGLTPGQYREQETSGI